MIGYARSFTLFVLVALGLVACSDDETTTADADADVGLADADADDSADTPADADAGDEGDTEDDSTSDVTDVGDADPDAEPDGFPIDELGPITDLRIDVLGAPVEIKFDAYGIPSLLCQTDEDCAAVLGYLHARDRFGQMDIRRRLVRGRLSEIVGAGDLVLDIDVRSRALFSTSEGRPIEEVLVESASEKTMGLLEAYANGVNAWIDDLENGRNGASLPAEYGFQLIFADPIRPWTPEDSAATVAALIENLTNDASDDLALGEVLAAFAADPDFDATVFDDYFRPRPFSSATTISDYTYPAEAGKAGVVVEGLTPARLAASRTALSDARAVLAPIRALLGGTPDRGSNNWVLGPGLTAAGNALLANDPHLGLANPSVWYLAHLDAKTEGAGDYHIAGLTFAGLPWVLLGQSEDLAWGATNSSFDFSDVYVEQLTEDGTGVVFGETSVPFTEVALQFRQADGQLRTRTARYVPHHGPVLSIDAEAGTAVTLRWTGSGLSSDINYLTELARATTLEEGRTAARNVTSIGQNWVMIDTSGNIGWFPYNTVPLRSWATVATAPYLPLDGTGPQEWDGFLAYEDLPQAFNPEAGYLATANNDMTGATLDGDPANDGHPWLQSYPAIGFREERIQTRIEASAAHTRETMRDLVGDTTSLVGEVASPALLAVDRASLSSAGQALYDALDGWDFACPTGLATSDPEGAASTDAGARASARGCAAFHRVFSDAYRGWSADERADRGWPTGPRVESFVRALVRPEELANPNVFWDDLTTEAAETQDDVLSGAFESGATWFEAELGGDTTDWLWGRVHTTTLAADLFSSLGVPFYDAGPWAKDGGLFTVNVASPGVGAASLNHRSGASMRLLCEAPAGGVSCSVQLPGGQPHFRSDPNYLGLIDNWLENQPVDLVFDHAALDSPVIEARARATE